MGTKGVAVVIDDDADVRGLLKRVCERAEITAHVAADGAAGIEAVRSQSPSVIILDYELPDMNGLEVARRLRSFTDSYIIMVTAAIDDIAHLYPAVGINDVLAKPFSVRELVSRLREIVEQAHSGR